ncbi:MAG: phosphoribosylglycinamide formyltransferase [Paracoccaceae bacterium]
MTRVAILISGGGSNMVALIEDMRERGYARPALVLSNVPGAGGLEKAAARGVPAFAIDHKDYANREGFEHELTSALLDHEIDVICLAGFMRVLTPVFTDRWQGKVLNIHPSLLPKYPGLHTHRRALEAGDAEAGCSVHVVTSTLDDGPLLGQARVAVAADDTPETLAARVLVQEHRLYPEVLRRHLLGETLPVILQDGVEAPMTTELSE